MMQSIGRRTRPRVWFVTGASSGLGRAIVEAAIAEGDVVVASSRNPVPLEPLAERFPDQLETIELDVTDHARATSVVEDVTARYGAIDVLVNNAGRGHIGSAEAATHAELSSLFDLHFFGPAHLVRLVLPGMRSRGSGAIVQISSFGGQVAYPGFSVYCSTKFALEGYSEALAAEVAPHGITVLIAEPGALRTAFSGSALRESEQLDAYADTAGATKTMIKGLDGVQPGDPARAAAVIVGALASPSPPLRLPLGNDAVDGILDHLRSIEAEVRQWEPISRQVDFDRPALANDIPPVGGAS